MVVAGVAGVAGHATCEPGVGMGNNTVSDGGRSTCCETMNYYRIAWYLRLENWFTDVRNCCCVKIIERVILRYEN